MSFHADKQTVDELNLLGKYRLGSVYHLFNHVKTRGGEELLDKMFRHPLTDASGINQRSNILQWFQQQNMAFPFDVQQLDLMREYIDSGQYKNAVLSFADTLFKKWLSGLTRDQRYRKTVQGLQATIVTLNKCCAFVEGLSFAGPYASRLQKVKDTLAGKPVERLRNMDIFKALPVKTLAFYNHLLKNRLLRDMEEVLAFIYEVDVYIAISDVARTKGFSYPEALAAEENILSARNLSHPCIQRATGNDLLMQKDTNMLFLTGANMAGKSTLMKAVGINLYLAHMGFPIAADEFVFSVREGIYSSINTADNIGLGYSHFYAEVLRVKQAAQATASGKRLLLMFDELFKGTNVKDAYDGTLSVTEAFAAYHECLFIISTHIIEVGDVLKNQHNIQFAFLPTVLEGSRPRYTYKLQNGVTEDRQGMMIIRNEGILELIAPGD